MAVTPTGNFIHRRPLLCAMAALPLASALSRPARARPEPRIASYPLFDTPPETHNVDHFDVTAEGRGYRIFRTLPKQTAPAAGHPSLWMLDGNAAFSRLTREHLAAHPGLAVITIGYPVDTEFDFAARALDYTPEAAGPEADPRNPGRPTGGDRSFRRALLGPLTEAARSDARLDPARKTLWGHSFGGLFTLTTLFATPDAFAGWCPTSPSAGYGDGVLASIATQAPLRQSGQRAPLLIQLGDSEHRSDTPAPEKAADLARPAPPTMALAAQLRDRPDLTVTVKVLQGLGHGETFAASYPAALDLAASL